jgi:hypothetical protein
MQSSSEEPAGSAEQARLNGWKEIAAHLGKGVRTVQRWEHEYGVPIRRIGREGGEIVFAFREEIDSWSKESSQGRRAKAEVSPDPPDVAPNTLEHSTSRVAQRSRYWWAAGLTFVVAAALIYLAAFAGSSPLPQPVRALVSGRELVTFDASGRRLWTRPLEFEPNLDSYARVPAPSSGTNWVQVADLDKSGDNEVILATNSLGVQGPQGFSVFNADGTVRFRIEPTDRVTFGEEQFDGPWAVYRMFVIDNPDGSRSLWAAFIHSLLFPTLVLEIDARGSIKSKYWSNGYVEQIEVASVAGRHRVLIAGTHNDSRGASLAIFDLGQVHGSAPAEKDRFRCKTCAAGGPDEFLVFPRKCFAEQLSGQATVADIRVDSAGRLFLLAGEGDKNAAQEFVAGVWYTIEPDFSSGSMLFSIGSVAMHDELEKAGRLQHPFAGPEHHADSTFSRWKGGNLVPVSIVNRTPYRAAGR